MTLRNPFHPNIVHPLLGATALGFALSLLRCLLLLKADWLGMGLFHNLVLAWIPYGLSWMAFRESQRPRASRVRLAGIILLWLLFLPNASYMITDLVHWRREPPLPAWFDWIYISALAWTGLFLAFLSIQYFQRCIEIRWGQQMGKKFALAALALSSFGIYAGRFFRWNSWDAILRPSLLLKGFAKLRHPAIAADALAFCGVFFLFSCAIYFLLNAVASGGETEQ